MVLIILMTLIFGVIIGSNLMRGIKEDEEKEVLIYFSKWKEDKGYRPILDHKGLVEEFLKNKLN